MGIIYNEKAKTFTLHTQNTTYQMDFYCIYIMEERQMELWIIF